MRACRACGGEVQAQFGPRLCREASCVKARTRPATVRPCDTCGRPHKSERRSCQACRWRAQGTRSCSTCGDAVSPRAKQCRRCRTDAMRTEQNPAGAGASNGRWKGGRRTTSAGYVYVYAPDHPAAGGSRSVAEHVLVMEEMLGRYLLPGENVHHRNGQRADNRRENLELWVRAQPAGQRAEDLVVWAREILARYAPVMLNADGDEV